MAQAPFGHHYSHLAALGEFYEVVPVARVLVDYVRYEATASADRDEVADVVDQSNFSSSGVWSTNGRSQVMTSRSTRPEPLQM